MRYRGASRSSNQEGPFGRGYSRKGARAVPAGGAGIVPAGITTGEPGAWLKRDPKAKVTPSILHRVKRGPGRVESVRPATRAAVERRKASAPESGWFVQTNHSWRAPRPKALSGGNI